MRDIAAEAAVAVPTVEAAFGTKARLLKAAIDTAIAGDEAPVPMLERAWAARARAAPDATTVVAEFAGTLTASAQRAAGLVSAAPMPPAWTRTSPRSPPSHPAARDHGRLVRRRTHSRSSLRHGISGDEAIEAVWPLSTGGIYPAHRPAKVAGDAVWCLVHRHSHPAATRPRARSALNGTRPPGHPPCFNQCPGVSDRLDMPLDMSLDAADL